MLFEVIPTGIAIANWLGKTTQNKNSFWRLIFVTSTESLGYKVQYVS